ncbi:MAG TPA: hypothetical protein ENI23_06195 [bacterium]|nr:hypothetical protein [bacterium]
MKDKYITVNPKALIKMRKTEKFLRELAEDIDAICGMEETDFTVPENDAYFLIYISANEWVN